MTLTRLLLLFFNVPLVVMYHHEKPIAEKLWSERCRRNSIALNDCNWCRCNAQAEFVCKAQICNEVDMFGHFNDAIRDMDVGMEGHGAWRSGGASCEQQVHYRKKDILCVCTDDGKWPNPLCRDTFQVLHAVETSEFKEPESNHTCSATKLYLYECNVCFCPSTGHIDPKLCTKRKCLEKKDNIHYDHYDKIDVAYAECIPTKSYAMGSRKCVCIKNNILLCEDYHEKMYRADVVCNGVEPGVVFNKDCNSCYCNTKDTTFCSTKHCLPIHTRMSLPNDTYNWVDQSQDEYNCKPGTKWEKECNTCHCFLQDGIKYVGCSLQPCHHDHPNPKTKRTCVVETSYQVNCLICHCVLDRSVKHEFCTVDVSCATMERGKGGEYKALSSMHGYCEPMHYYKSDCRECRCLPDGQTVACSGTPCAEKEERTNREHSRTLDESQRFTPKAMRTTKDKAIVMEFIPFIQKDNYCPKGHTYMVDCNLCYCMPTGNAICTTKQC